MKTMSVLIFVIYVAFSFSCICAELSAGKVTGDKTGLKVGKSSKTPISEQVNE